MHPEAYSEPPPQPRHSLTVWGDLTPAVQRLLGGLARRGWSPEPGGWPQAGGACKVSRDEVQLIAVDDGSGADLERLQPLLIPGSGARVFVCTVADTKRDDMCSILANYAYGYQCLPGDASALDVILRQAHSMAVLRCAASGSRHNASSDTTRYEMLGTSPAMLSLFDAIHKVAPVDVPVLLRGESGTGKELVARAIHENSKRSDGPFIAINCGALPSELVQSELFGHEKGAFTGASERHIGRVERAAGGILLLDEVGDLPLPLQMYLLRFLESGRFYRVGGTEETFADVRVFAATHVPLEQAIREGRFRADLYHRLDVISLDVPPLRERVEDIDLLAQSFFERFTADRPGRVRGISQEALRRMRQHPWPGNVRELKNDVHRAVVLGEHRLITSSDLGFNVADAVVSPQTLAVARTRAEREQVQAALTRSRYHIAAAARQLEVSRVTLHRLLHKHELESWLRESRGNH